MGMRTYRPVTAASRHRQTADFDEITKHEPEKSLLRPRQRVNGRNFQGRQTIWHRGGGHKRQYRVIDFKRDKIGIPGKVVGVEYDPNRSARIALIQYADGEKRYILCPVGLTVGTTISSGSSAEIKPGNTLALKDIPVGEQVHNIELKPGKGGVMVRGAGTSAQLMAKVGRYSLLRMPSGEQRQVLVECMATIGVVSNPEHFNRRMGKAGVSRWLGRRPHNRGVTMNPVDHPHGGGEGKTSGGRHPVTPWGKKTKGKKTRHNKRTEKFITRHRR